MNTGVEPLNWTAVYPPVWLAGLAVGVVLLDAVFWPRRAARRHLGHLSLLGALLALSAALNLWRADLDLEALSGLLLFDAGTLFFEILLLSAGVLSLLLSLAHPVGRGVYQGEYYALVLLAVVGLMLLAGAADLVSLLLGFALAQLALGALVGMKRKGAGAGEAGVKYWLLGAVAGAFLLYGIALVYGAVGSTQLPALAARAREAPADGLLVAGVGLLLVALGFNLGLVPFHAWAPDAHQGAPTPVAALLGTGSAAAALIAAARLLQGFAPLAPPWTSLLWALAALSMTGGNLLALNQRNLKRLLACGGIAQAGYALVGFAAASAEAVAGALFHLAVYTLASAGCFGVLSLCRRRDEARTEVGDYGGLGRRHPLLALGLGLCLAALAGLPPTAGFLGRFYLFAAAMEAGCVGLVLVGLANSLLSAYVYFRVLNRMYLRAAPAAAPVLAPRPEALAVVLLGALGALGLGLWPNALLEAARAAAATLR